MELRDMRHKATRKSTQSGTGWPGASPCSSAQSTSLMEMKRRRLSSWSPVINPCIELCEEDDLSASMEELSFLDSQQPFPPSPEEDQLNSSVPAIEPQARSLPDETNSDIISETQKIEATQVLRSAVELQVQMRTHIVNTLVKWRDIILLVWCHIKGLLSQERLVKDEGQSHQVRAVWREMAECITLQLSPAPLLAAWPQELPGGPLHHLVSEEHGDPCIPENHCVQTQLCHGVGKATLSLSSGPWRFSAHTDPGEQWLLSPEPNSEASVGLRNPPEMEHAVPPESEDATHGRPSLSVPEPAAALRQTMILGSSWGTWGVDSPPLRLMVQRSLLLHPRKMLLL
ncbi:uncharacterized protein LOC134475162 isoform X4 [Cavia porcellus]|uniref:uncharacterized protein LOC101788960 isoform X4 n=1 Tax=Cavia porcellus TaxID=10141 RepID=UPI002FDF6983